MATGFTIFMVLLTSLYDLNVNAMEDPASQGQLFLFMDRKGKYMEICAKVPPHSDEAERAVIGALLLDSHRIDEVLDIVMPHDFYFSHHQTIFSEIVDLHKNGKPIDPVLLISKLDTKLDRIVNHTSCYIYEMANSTPSPDNVIPYAEIVRERSILRQLIKIAEEAQMECLEGVELTKILDATELKVKLLQKIKG